MTDERITELYYEALTNHMGESNVQRRFARLIERETARECAKEAQNSHMGAFAADAIRRKFEVTGG